MRVLGIFLLFIISFSSFASEQDQLRRDVYKAILKHEPWILMEHLESASDAFMPFLSDEEVMTWDWSVRDVLSGISIEEVQLDKSDRKEVIIQTFARTYCGSGGCNAYILKLDGDEPRYLGTFFYNGKLIEPDLAVIKESYTGFYDFAIQGSSIDVYRFDKNKNEYKLD